MSENTEKRQIKQHSPSPAGITSPFDKLVSQPYAARFLSTAVSTGQESHAYLFVGPLGAGKTEAALLLAEALLCGRGVVPGNDSATDSAGANAVDNPRADGPDRARDSAAGSRIGSETDSEVGPAASDDCLRVRHGTHPDLHCIDPLGASGYLAEQIAEIIHDATLAPIRARRKIYLITRADLLKGTTANALLKTLEEPPASVTFVLLARTREAVLPTILSRCQAIAFRRVPEAQAEQTVCARSGEQPDNARIALAVCGGSVYRAVEFIRSSERRAARLEVLEVLEQLDNTDDLQLLEAVKRLLVVLKAPLDAVKVEQELQREKSQDYLGKGAQTRLEQQHKRELSTRERETVGEAMDVVRSWLRDALMLRTGFAPVNYDHYYHIARTAQRASEPQILAALASVDAAQEQIQYNVAVQLALEGMFLRIRMALS